MGCNLSVNLFRNKCEHKRTPSSSMNITSDRKRIFYENIDAAIPALKAVLLIQKYFRRYRARCEARRHMTWRIHQMIEYSMEQNQVLLQKLFRITLNQKETPFLQMKGFEPVATLGQEQGWLGEQINWAAIDELDVNYSGIKIEYPITAVMVKTITDFLKAPKNKLSNRDLIQLVLHSHLQLQSQPNIHEISANSITVCGDIHGNFDDLITIFQKNCFPSTSNPYVFNGDFVDRGSHSLEVIIVLFACLLQDQRALYLNRGNHEDHYMNGRYGFHKEIRAKYRDISELLIKLFTGAFAVLPLASIFNDSILITHGGISNDTDLALIKSLRREKFVSILNFESSNMDINDIKEWKQVLNLLWSDPRPVMGCKMNTFRGGGCYFGPDVTSKFLEKNKFQLLIRSHECKMNGWEYCHDNLVLTIFSASNYYELGSNFGAYITIDKANNVSVNEFRSQDAVALRKSEEESVRCLKAEIWQRRHSLMDAFLQIDREKTGIIPINEWAIIMKAVMNMDLPWRQLKRYLINDDIYSTVSYLVMMDELDKQQKHQNLAAMGLQLYSDFNSDIEMMFQLFDQNNSGRFSFADFKDFFKKINSSDKPVRNEDLERLWSSFDLNNDGWIDKSEFVTVANKHM